MQKHCFQCSVYIAYNECPFVLREKELKKQKRKGVLYKLLHGYVNKHKVAKLLSDILRRKGAQKVKDYIYRMMDDRKDLVEKWEKLTRFKDNNYHNLDDTERYLMQEQVEIIDKYIWILDARISHAIVKEQLKEDEK